MIHELDCVVLETPLPELGLDAGALGTVVLVHEGGRGFEVEFLGPDGDTLGVVTLSRDAVERAG